MALDLSVAASCRSRIVVGSSLVLLDLWRLRSVRQRIFHARSDWLRRSQALRLPVSDRVRQASVLMLVQICPMDSVSTLFVSPQTVAEQ